MPAAFGGDGGATTDNRNITGDGGGGAGLGGAVFARAGSVLFERVRFSANGAQGGSGGFTGESGQGKGAALFVADDAQARALCLVFEGNDAADAEGTGFVPGVLSDSDDVYGVVLDQVLLRDGFEDLPVGCAPAAVE